MFTNELIHETSPYLLQHAHNPVEWMPWGAAAFEKAGREDKPIFLSVGYSTCHWCHVMAHESFENEEVAKILNEHFVSIKVDREELPDVDDQYMLATQLITRRGGGWPNSLWLTPDRRPWFAGTYFPREDQGNMSGFKSLLRHLADAWKNQRPEIEKMADQMTEILREIGAKEPAKDEGKAADEAWPLNRAAVEHAVQIAGSSYDSRFGGFGSRPKFPPHGTLSLLIYQIQKEPDPTRQEMITRTLEAMRLGGIYDHVGGGFHRYATDEYWFLPHFEKMLYDNAQLIGNYADAYEVTGRENEDFRRVVRETFEWLQREMTDPAGGFYSALDADSLNEEGHAEEGKFYVWTPQQTIETLGKADGTFFNLVYGITQGGNFREEATGRQTGDSIPSLARPLAETAEAMKCEPSEFHDRFQQIRKELLEERAKRPRPHCDDKVLTGWNGLMIDGLARAGRVFGEPEYIEAAARAATFVLENLRDDQGRLLRTWRDGQAKLPAYFDDYAFFIQGLLELHRATDDPRWLNEAIMLAEQMVTDFSDPVHGGFFLTSSRHDPLLFRNTGMIGGGNIPSSNGVAARALMRLAVLTKNPTYVTTARGVLEAYRQTICEQPAQAEHLVIALGEFLDLLAVELVPTFQCDGKRCC